jgi:signal transduction histidine kinase
VSDTGEGIGLEKQKMLFTPFYQADSSSTRAHGGTGTIFRSLIFPFYFSHREMVFLSIKKV